MNIADISTKPYDYIEHTDIPLLKVKEQGKFNFWIMSATRVPSSQPEKKYVRMKSSDSLLKVNTIHPMNDDKQGKWKHRCHSVWCKIILYYMKILNKIE